MDDFDLVIRGGTVATAADVFAADVGVNGDRIVALGAALPSGRREIDARGKLVLPGGVDSHCHIEQLSSMGIMCADDFHTATVSAAFGGTTTVMSFCSETRLSATDPPTCPAPRMTIFIGEPPAAKRGAL